jgi:uncharacterized membrane protein YvbJ
MKNPRFFCDNCDTEVDRDAKICPQCGRFFASVRCPQCGFTGTEGLFVSGCPKCGYSTSGAPPAPPRKGGSPAKQKQPDPVGTLPMWVYILTALAAICVFAILFTFL